MLESTYHRAPHAHLRAIAALGIALLAICGCKSTNTQVTSLQSQNRVLTEQSRAQLAEIQNLKIHARSVEDKLINAEREIAELDQRGGGHRPAPTALGSPRLKVLAEAPGTYVLDN